MVLRPSLPAVTTPSTGVLVQNERNRLLADNARRNAAIRALGQIGDFTTRSAGLASDIVGRGQREELANRGLTLRERLAGLEDQRLQSQLERSRTANELAERRLGLEADREARLLDADAFTRSQLDLNQEAKASAEAAERAHEIELAQIRRGNLDAFGNPVQTDEEFIDMKASLAGAHSFDPLKAALLGAATNEQDLFRILSLTAEEVQNEVRARGSGAFGGARSGEPSFVPAPSAAPVAPAAQPPPAVQDAVRRVQGIGGAAQRAAGALGIPQAIDAVGNALQSADRAILQSPFGALVPRSRKTRSAAEAAAKKRLEERKKLQKSKGGLPVPPKR